MMMRQIVSYLIASLTIIVIALANPAFGAVVDNRDLTDLISQYNDTHMTVEDLAFFLAIHNFYATPKEGYVQVTIDGLLYRAIPNSATGFAELSTMN